MVVIESAGIGCQNLTIQVERIPRVGGGVTAVVHSVLLTRFYLVSRDLEVAEMIRSFDKGCLEA